MLLVFKFYIVIYSNRCVVFLVSLICCYYGWTDTLSTCFTYNPGKEVINMMAYKGCPYMRDFFLGV